MGKNFASALQEISLTDKKVLEAKWLSRKELLEAYSESEAEELVDCGYIVTRPHPANPRRMQFRKVTEGERRVVDKKQNFVLSSSHQVEGDVLQRMHTCLKDANPDGKVLRKHTQLYDMMGLAAPVSVSGSDEEEPTQKKLKLTKVRKVGKARESQARGSQDPAPPEEEPQPQPEAKFKWEEQSVCALQPSQYQAKARKLILLLGQKEMMLTEVSTLLKSSTYGTPNKVEEVETLQATLASSLQSLKTAISKSSASDDIKQLLLQGVAVMKTVDGKVKEVRAVLKAEAPKAA